MEKQHNLNLDSGTVEMLCNCCDYHSYKLAKEKKPMERRDQLTEDWCKQCVDNYRNAIFVN